ncbi:GAF domain-containing sensor histidine kinase [Reichenbachiella ulvae]|uniref:histidine kinase n=1 Tax=Reichenbachiella ulvae TaxID=2980104 RepID=A0ABT3CVX8_9BACT|nr:sensor histidine kinase [Reichenbachiella ulvae]MCV9387865.1 ATP-binding protein [Reichenbachiella ulvae]
MKPTNPNPASVLNNFAESLSQRELSILMDISTHIATTLDYREVLQIISDGISELLKTDTATIYSLQEDQSIYLEVATPTMSTDFQETFRYAKVPEHPHIQQALKTRSPIIIEDTSNEPLSPQEKKVLELSDVKSLLFLPLVLENELFGILIMGAQTEIRKFTPHEIRVGEMVANHLSGAIQKTILHQNLKTYKDTLEDQVKKRTQELEKANMKLVNKNQLAAMQRDELEVALEQLKVAQTRMVQTEKMVSLGTLTAGVAHEIKNPLNFIHGSYLGLMRFFKEANIEDKDAWKMLDSIKLGIERSTAIVSVLNDFSRNQKAPFKNCNIHQIIDNCLLMLNRQFDRKGITLEKIYSPQSMETLANANKLHQLFINILLNACQSIPKEGIVKIETQTEKDWLKINISDTGVGIKKENLQQIIEPFFTTKDPGQGTGLGLSISYSIIEDHKGEMEFDSEENKGTTVRIKLPVTKKNQLL